MMDLNDEWYSLVFVLLFVSFYISCVLLANMKIDCFLFLFARYRFSIIMLFFSTTLVNDNIVDMFYIFPSFFLHLNYQRKSFKKKLLSVVSIYLDIIVVCRVFVYVLHIVQILKSQTCFMHAHEKWEVFILLLHLWYPTGTANHATWYE